MIQIVMIEDYIDSLIEIKESSLMISTKGASLEVIVVLVVFPPL
tara:strand:+ start:693 stop:824 length:132 start_codon:yes stop_codon:yes gene_type:complete